MTIWQRSPRVFTDGAVARQLSATGSRRPRRSSGWGSTRDTAREPRSAPASRSARRRGDQRRAVSDARRAGGARPDLRRGRRLASDAGAKTRRSSATACGAAAFGARPGRPRPQGRRSTSEPYTVIGVMPPAFSFPTTGRELWVPLRLRPARLRGSQQQRALRRRPARSRARRSRARAPRWTLLAAQSRQQFPKENENTDATVNGLRDELSRQSRMMVLALERRRALRAADRLRQPGQPAARARARTPAGAGGPHRAGRRTRAADPAARHREPRPRRRSAARSACCWPCSLVPLLWRLVPANLPTAATPGIDLRVLAFAAALTLVTALAFGLAPMLRTGADADVQRPARGRARDRRHGRRSCAARS